MADFNITYNNALDLMDEATGISALLDAALRQWEVSPYDTNPQECTDQLVNAITGVLILAKQHSQNMDNTFSI